MTHWPLKDKHGEDFRGHLSEVAIASDIPRVDYGKTEVNSK